MKIEGGLFVILKQALSKIVILCVLCLNIVLYSEIKPSTTQSAVKNKHPPLSFSLISQDKNQILQQVYMSLCSSGIAN